MAKTDQLFEDDNPLALRQPRTDPLILAQLLRAAGEDQPGPAIVEELQLRLGRKGQD